MDHLPTLQWVPMPGRQWNCPPTWMMFMEFQEVTGGDTPSCDPLATSGNPLGRRALPEVSTGTQWAPLAELFFLVELAFILSPLPRFILSPSLFLLASHTPKGLVIRLAPQRERPGWGVVQASFPITATPASGKNTFCSVPGIPLAWKLGMGASP